MFSVNGNRLHDPSRGWFVRPGSERFVPLSLTAASLSVPGAHGLVPLPTTFGATGFNAIVNVTPDGLESLLALVSRPGGRLSADGAPFRDALFELLSVGYEGHGRNFEYTDVNLLLRLPGAFWRDVADQTSAALALTAAVGVANAFPGMSAPVGDSIIRFKGQCAGIRVEDAGGSWFTYSAPLPSGSYLRFHAGTGEAFVTTTNTWVGGDSVSGDIDFNGPRGVFEVTPSFADPAIRQAKLTVTTTSRAGATVEIRGKGAYLV